MCVAHFFCQKYQMLAQGLIFPTNKFTQSSPMNVIKGDLILLAKEGAFDVIAHGCNCQGNMGKGLAQQVTRQFPLAQKLDTPDALPGEIRGIVHPDGLIVVNAYTQILPGIPQGLAAALSPIDGYKKPFFATQENRYEFLRYCMQGMNLYFPGKRLGLPMIGAGLAGGDWKRIQPIIEEEITDMELTIVMYKK